MYIPETRSCHNKAPRNADAFFLLFFCYTGIHDDLSFVWLGS